MRLRSALFQFCLAFTLLLAQQGAYWHALTHLAAESEQRQDKSLPDSKACPLDGAYAKVGSGMAAVPLAIAPVCGAERVALIPEFVSFAPAPAPNARAPPVSL